MFDSQLNYVFYRIITIIFFIPFLAVLIIKSQPTSEVTR